MARSIRFIALTVLIVILWLFSVILYTHQAVDASQANSLFSNNKNNVVSPHAIVGDKEEAFLDALWPEDGQDNMFFLSMTSCADDCGPELPPEQPLKVGLLVLPGSMSQIFLNFCKTSAHHFSNTSGEKKINTKIQWIPTHHLPPSTDEYTHIVRFATVPLLLSVGDALRSVASPDELVSWQDVEDTTKLIISWHCHLSSLANEETYHLLTMSMEELEQDQYEEESTLMTFLSIDSDGSEGDSSDHLNEEEMEKTLDKTIRGIRDLLKVVNKQILQERQEGIVSLTKKTIKGIVSSLQGCPVEEELFQPKAPMAQRVHQFLKKGTEEDDKTLCKHATIASTLACQEKLQIT
eukprot:scaffold1669_cov129-Cylindrotheca_fusiformis.AAC.22